MSMEPLIIECSLNEQVTKAQNASVPIARAIVRTVPRPACEISRREMRLCRRVRTLRSFALVARTQGLTLRRRGRRRRRLGMISRSGPTLVKE